MEAPEAIQDMVANFGYLVDGVVAGSGNPRYGGGLRDTLQWLFDQGVRAILSLTEEPLPGALVREYDMELEHIPVVDFTAPSQPQIDKAVDFIRRNAANKRPTLVHCGAGYGRTGTILACYLVAEGRPAREAIARVRAKRPGSIEVHEQEQAVRDYALRLGRE